MVARRALLIVLLVVASLVVVGVGCEPKKAAVATLDGAVAASSSTTPTAEPSVAAAPRAYDTSCARDEDCVPAPGCCPVPCTPRVVNRKEIPAIDADNAKQCPKNPQCFSAGACRTYAYLCVSKACKLVFAGDPDFRARQ